MGNVKVVASFIKINALVAIISFVYNVRMDIN